MDIDFDDLISTDTANTAKAGIKFQPKGRFKPKPKPKPNSQPEPKSTQSPPKPTPSSQFVEAAASTEGQSENNVNQIIGNVVESLQSSFAKSQEENAESFLTLDSPNDFLPESTTTVNLPPCPEIPTVVASMDGNVKVGPTEPELINNIDPSSNLESIAEIDPLTGEEGTIVNDNEGFQIGNLSSRSKEAENSLFLEPDDILAQSITGSGPKASKFKPKPKAQKRKLKRAANNPVQDVGPLQHGENVNSVSSFSQEEILTDLVPTETISDYHLTEEESISLSEISQMDSVNEAGRSSERLTRLASKALYVIDEAEIEIIDNNNNDIDFVPENESLDDRIESKSKSKSKSKKPVDENKKPVKKRKKATEVQNELTEVPKKKFSHSTKRNKRQVNPELLKIPEDELELHMHTFPIKDLIRLREHKERLEIKEGSSSRTDATDGSEYAENTTYYNYRTHMKIIPRVKWTKQDTELFYEAIQQLGTDLSMVTECFPGRTREQIKSKFKKEYKQNRLRIESALNTRAKGHSQFNIVIERLKQARAEDEDSENDDQYADMPGEEDEVQVAADINEGGLEKEVKDMEPDENPTAFDDIEDDDNTWSQYKSEI
ncbi:uncharacterized protein LOC143629455 [Bidens hawaiensis]|uniref:uncharacterized protein LOC143629455 n=1 Tax=Bidens hawaiensis TaxID=980011 RepID=UPI00404A106B